MPIFPVLPPALGMFLSSSPNSLIQNGAFFLKYLCPNTWKTLHGPTVHLGENTQCFNNITGKSEHTLHSDFPVFTRWKHSTRSLKQPK